MNNFFFSIVVLIATSCKTQTLQVIDFSNKKELYYIVANIDISDIKRVSLYNDAFFIKTFQMYESKVKNDTKTHEMFKSILISISPDGDYYNNSNYCLVKCAFD